MSSKPIIYHEKQVKELCALHALNNLFQARNSFTKSELDYICSQLSPNVWINPHRSMLGLGNYDINVIMSALQRKGYEAIWFDKRKDPDCLQLEHISGFILNVPSDYKLGFMMLPLRRRHWATLREIHGHFYNLDSKLETPQLIGRSSELIAYLKQQLDSKDKELFVVVSSQVEREQLWLRPPAPPPAQQPYLPPTPPPGFPKGMTYYDSPDSLSSSSSNSYQARDAESLRLSEVQYANGRGHS